MIGACVARSESKTMAKVSNSFGSVGAEHQSAASSGYLKVGGDGVVVVCGRLIRTHSARANQGRRQTTSSVPWRQLNITTLELL